MGRPSDGEESRDSRHDDRDDDQFHARLDPEKGSNRTDQEINAKIGNHRPFEAVEALKLGVAGEIELHAVASDMPHQIGQRRQGRPIERDCRHYSQNNHDPAGAACKQVVHRGSLWGERDDFNP